MYEGVPVHWGVHAKLIYNAIELSQPEIARKSTPPILAFKVIDLGSNRKPVYDFVFMINGNLGRISHRFWDTAIYWLKIVKFFYPSHFMPR